jgi:uncharacterized membrane protein YtjA (UPF0391 family)
MYASGGSKPGTRGAKAGYTMVSMPLGSLPYGACGPTSVQLTRIWPENPRKNSFQSPIQVLHSQGQLLKKSYEEVAMLRWALGFFIVALVAALLGFTGIAVAAAGIAKILFYLFLILFLVTLVGHLLRRT